MPVEVDFWGRSSRRPWIAIVAVALAAAAVVAAWPTSGAASSGTPASAQAQNRDEPSRHDAIAVAAPHSAAVAQATDRVSEARAAVNELKEQLGAVHTEAYQKSTEVLPLAAADSLARTRTQRYAGAADRALTAGLFDAEQKLAAAEQEQEQALADYFAALAAAAQAEAESAAEADRVARERSASTGAASNSAEATSAVAAGASSTGTCAGELACFLACTRAHESDTAGGYAAVSPDGLYHGAYQFDQTTWDSVADSIGRADLVGVDPASATPADQDTLATALYAMRGNQPWGGRC